MSGTAVIAVRDEVCESCVSDEVCERLLVRIGVTGREIGTITPSFFSLTSLTPIKGKDVALAERRREREIGLTADTISPERRGDEEEEEAKGEEEEEAKGEEEEEAEEEVDAEREEEEADEGYEVVEEEGSSSSCTSCCSSLRIAGAKE